MVKSSKFAGLVLILLLPNNTKGKVSVKLSVTHTHCEIFCQILGSANLSIIWVTIFAKGTGP